MHAPGKGMSSSALPYVRKAPTWLRLSKDEIVDSIITGDLKDNVFLVYSMAQKFSGLHQGIFPSFLSDPGVPGIRSMGPVLSH